MKYLPTKDCADRRNCCVTQPFTGDKIMVFHKLINNITDLDLYSSSRSFIIL